MARHYYRTTVPLGIMFLKWIGIALFFGIYLLYDACANGPKRTAQAQWDRDHFNGWRLEAQTYDTQHGLYFDNLRKETCTTKGYPGYPACPPQRYFVDGQPSTAPSN